MDHNWCALSIEAAFNRPAWWSQVWKEANHSLAICSYARKPRLDQSKSIDTTEEEYLVHPSQEYWAEVKSIKIPNQPQIKPSYGNTD